MVMVTGVVGRRAILPVRPSRGAQRLGELADPVGGLQVESGRGLPRLTDEAVALVATLTACTNGADISESTSGYRHAPTRAGHLQIPASRARCTATISCGMAFETPDITRGALGQRGQHQAVPTDERRDDVAVVVNQFAGLIHVGAGVLDVLDVLDLAGERADSVRVEVDPVAGGRL